MPDDTPQTEFPCLVHAHDHLVRGTLRLPGKEATGRLRLEEDAPELPDESDAPLALTLLDSGSGTPAAAMDWFIRRRQIRLPIQAPYPIELHLDRAITGSHDPDQRYETAAITNKRVMTFLGSSQFDLAQLSALQETRHDHLAVDLPEGQRLHIAEVVKRQEAEHSLTHNFDVELRLTGPARSLSQWVGVLSHVLHLVALCLDQPLTPERIYAPTPDRDICFFANWRETAAPLNTRPLFLLSELGESKAASLAASWVKLSTDSADLINHVIELQLRGPNLLLSDRLLLVARSLELMHSTSPRYNSTVRSRSDHGAIVSTVLAGMPSAIDQQDREWIKAALNEANRKRFRHQIEELVEGLGANIRTACGLAEVSTFARDLVKMRNHLTHPSGRASPVGNGRQLIKLVHRAWFLLRGSLLIDLGLEEERIAAALQRSSERFYLVHD